MLRTFIALMLIAGTFVFSSCGPSKKMRAATARIDSLVTANADLTNLKNSLQDSVKAGQDALKAAGDALQASQTQCETDKAELSKTKNALTEEYGRLDALRQRIADEQKDFLGDDGEVKLENGRIKVEMGTTLLYSTGSSIVNGKGKKGLGALSTILNEYPDLKVSIVGGTDDKPFKAGSDNWSLSTERANSVVRILTGKNGISPDRLTSAGKGQYAPVADNTTAAGRAKNRRTELVLNPNLDKIWEEITQ